MRRSSQRRRTTEIIRNTCRPSEPNRSIHRRIGGGGRSSGPGDGLGCAIRSILPLLQVWPGRDERTCEWEGGRPWRRLAGEAPRSGCCHRRRGHIRGCRRRPLRCRPVHRRRLARPRTGPTPHPRVVPRPGAPPPPPHLVPRQGPPPPPPRLVPATGAGHRRLARAPRVVPAGAAANSSSRPAPGAAATTSSPRPRAGGWPPPPPASWEEWEGNNDGHEPEDVGGQRELGFAGIGEEEGRGDWGRCSRYRSGDWVGKWASGTDQWDPSCASGKSARPMTTGPPE
jgi:hypothetical protein